MSVRKTPPKDLTYEYDMAMRAMRLIWQPFPDQGEDLPRGSLTRLSVRCRLEWYPYH